MSENATPKNGDEKRVPPAVWKPIFLEALRNSGNVRSACIKAGINRDAAYKQKARGNGFAAQWDEAMEDAIDVLEAAAWKRASQPDNPSDTLLIFLLKSHRRRVYGEKVSGDAEAPLRIVIEYGDNGNTAESLAAASRAARSLSAGTALERAGVRETLGENEAGDIP